MSKLTTEKIEEIYLFVDKLDNHEDEDIIKKISKHFSLSNYLAKKIYKSILITPEKRKTALKYYYADEFEACLKTLREIEYRNVIDEGIINYTEFYFTTDAISGKENKEKKHQEIKEKFDELWPLLNNRYKKNKDPYAAILIGLYYFQLISNVVNKRNVEKAKEYFLIGIKKLNSGFAMNYYAITVGNNKEGLDWLLKASEQGYATAFNNAARILYHGDGDVDVDKDKAIELYRKGAEAGSRFAITNYGILIFYGECDFSKQEAVRLFKEAIRKKHNRAYRYLGLCYLRGIGTEVSEKLAIQYFEKAIQNGYLAAYEELIEIYKRKNKPELVDKYAKAFYDAAVIYYQDQNKNYFSYSYLAICYQNGFGVERSDLEAIKIYKDAYEKYKLNNALIDAAEIYINKESKAFDPKEGIKLLEFTAAQKNCAAYLMLGKLYKDGEIVKKDYRKALSNLKKALKSSKYAHVYIAEIYAETGKFDLAIENYQLAIDAGIISARLPLLKVRFESEKANNIFEKRFKAADLKNKDAGLELLKIKEKKMAIPSDVYTTINESLTLYPLLYSQLKNQPDFDFSPIVVLLCKSMEIFMRKVFSIDYSTYLKKKGISPNEYSYTNSLTSYSKEKKAYEFAAEKGKFTLGSIEYLFNIIDTKNMRRKDDNGISSKYFINEGDSRFLYFDKNLVEYMKSIFDVSGFDDEVSFLSFIYDLQVCVGFLNDKIRKFAVHYRSISLLEANLVIELLLFSEGFLVKLLNSYKQ